MAKMSTRDKVGLAIVIGIFCLFGIILALMIDRPSGPTRGFEDNVIVEQRIKNLENR